MKAEFSMARMLKYAGYLALAGIVGLAVEAGIKGNKPFINNLEVKVTDVNEVNEPNELEVRVIEPNEVNEPNWPAEANEPNEPGDYKSSISQAGINFIKRYEGFRPTSYPDGPGYSIGYGHQIRAGENLTNLTREEAHNLLMIDLKEVFEPIIHKYVKVELTQGQYDMLCSFVSNFGETKFAESTLLKKLNDGDYEGAAEEFGRWIHFEGERNDNLVSRRAEEKKIFQNNN